MKNGKMTLRAAISLAGVQTWAASIMPCALGISLACASGHRLLPWRALLCLAAAVLLQCAVNTLNDRRDFISGLDSAENCPDSADAALVFEGVSPREALGLAGAFLLGAGACGAALLALCGRGLLLYAAAGLVAIALYTLPGLRFCSLPLGEALSGAAMGIALPLAAYHVQADAPDARTAALCLPAAVLVGCIMLVNNTCDLEKDALSRRTLPGIIGRRAARRLLRACLAASDAGIAAIVLIFSPRGAAALPAMALSLALSPENRRLFAAALTMRERPRCMADICSAVRLRLGFYCLACLAAAL